MIFEYICCLNTFVKFIYLTFKDIDFQFAVVS